MALGGVGVSLAGFAGLIAALDRRPDAHSAVAAWRIRNIVIGGFMLTIAGFGVIAVYAITQEDVTQTVRITGAVLVVLNLLWMRVESRPGPEWPSRVGWWWGVGARSALVVGYIAVTVRGRVPLLQMLLMFQLLDPVSIFFFTVRDVASGRAGDVSTSDGRPS